MPANPELKRPPHRDCGCVGRGCNFGSFGVIRKDSMACLITPHRRSAGVAFRNAGYVFDPTICATLFRTVSLSSRPVEGILFNSMCGFYVAAGGRLKNSLQVQRQQYVILSLVGTTPSAPAGVCTLQLPVDGRLRRSALDHRKTLGERLAHLGAAVLRRKRCAAWSKWVEETRLWMEEQHLVRFGPAERPGRELLLQPQSCLCCWRFGSLSGCFFFSRSMVCR